MYSLGYLDPERNTNASYPLYSSRSCRQIYILLQTLAIKDKTNKWHKTEIMHRWVRKRVSYGKSWVSTSLLQSRPFANLCWARLLSIPHGCIPTDSFWRLHNWFSNLSVYQVRAPLLLAQLRWLVCTALASGTSHSCSFFVLVRVRWL
jgi:hypothetical protein